MGFCSDYTLAPGDQLEVRLIGQKDLDTKQTIAPDGSISLPLVNCVIAEGKTLKSLNEYLVSEYSKYVKNPQVVISLTPRPIYIIQHDVRKNTWDVKEAKSMPDWWDVRRVARLGHLRFNRDVTTGLKQYQSHRFE